MIYTPLMSERYGQSFLHIRRFFALTDTGTPAGIKCNMIGNVCSGSGDGINVWSLGGILFGKIVIPNRVAYFCFDRGAEICCKRR